MLSFQASLGLLAVAARTAGTSTISKLSEHLPFQTSGAGLARGQPSTDLHCAAAEAGLDEAALVAQRMRMRTSTIYKLSEHLAFQTWGAGLAWDHRLMLCAAAEAEGLDEAALVAQRMRIRTSMRL